jgi:deoxyribonuclease-4
MQIFSHNPRQWRQNAIPRKEAKRFKILRQKYDINPVFIHASYLINLTSRSHTILKKSINLLSYELINADTLGAEYVILHTGSAGGENDKINARNRAVKALEKTVRNHQFKARLLLENTAGKKGDTTSSIEMLADIIDRCRCEIIGGICIDTCHAFASGYDVRSLKGTGELISEIEKYVGLDKLKLIHVNDSKKPLGSKVDRHEHIGKGFIGIKGFNNLFSDRRIIDVPKILETPKKDEDDDKVNLRRILKILLRSRESRK